MDFFAFQTNAQFLDSKHEEFSLLLNYVALKNQTTDNPSRSTALNENSNRRCKPERLSGIEAQKNDFKKQKEEINEIRFQWQQKKEQNALRAKASNQTTLPFFQMADKFRLESFEQDVAWLLFFKAVSPDFRQKYKNADLTKFGRESNTELAIGNILQNLCPGDFQEQMAARKYFSIASSLVKHHIIQMSREVSDCGSILEVEVKMSQRIISWVSDDPHTYIQNPSFILEFPETQLSQVVLPKKLIDQVLNLIKGHGARELKKTILNQTISYGRALTFLEYGPPGTGKTLFAQALANHTGRPLVRFKGERSGWFDPESVLAEGFREAQLQNGIVFIDECDRYCRPDTEWLHPLLIEIEKTDAIIIMATNKPNLLDTALDRRFTLKIPFEFPNEVTRKHIWEKHIPSNLKLAPCVDLDHLARSYPLTGGYIKNAVLTAINMAHANGHEAILDQEMLENATRIQEKHIGEAFTTRRTVQPRIQLKDSFLPPTDQTKISRLVSIAKNYNKTLRQCPELLNAHIVQGFKILFHGPSYALTLQAAEAMASTLNAPIDMINLNCSADTDSLQKDALPIVLSASLGTGHLPILTDESGFLASLSDDEENVAHRPLFSYLSQFDGTVLVVSNCTRLFLPKWARIFHEQHKFDHLDPDRRLGHWQTALDGKIRLGEAEAIHQLVNDYDLSLENMNTVLYKLHLQIAAEDTERILKKEIIENTIHQVLSGNSKQEALFG
jgi:DNA polymerase III delta prime subunit